VKAYTRLDSGRSTLAIHMRVLIPSRRNLVDNAAGSIPAQAMHHCIQLRFFCFSLEGWWVMDNTVQNQNLSLALMNFGLECCPRAGHRDLRTQILIFAGSILGVRVNISMDMGAAW
jgi:hypothetical protein